MAWRREQRARDEHHPSSWRSAGRARPRRRDRGRFRDDGAAGRSRPAVRRAAVGRRRRRPPRPAATRATMPRPTCAACWPIRAGSSCSTMPASISASCGATSQVDCRPVYCTKIASRLVRTYTDRHGLKDLVRELLGIELDKAEQSSDWGADTLTATQQALRRPRRALSASRCAPASTACWRARDGPRWPRPASSSCRRGWRSISPAGPTRTCSPIERNPRHERRARRTR